MITGIIIGLLAIFAIVVVFSSYVNAPADRAFVVTGLCKKPRMLIGKAGFRVPFLERLDKLDLSLIPIDVKTSSEVPTADYINIRVDSNVNVRVGKSDELLARAATHFLNKRGSDIAVIVREVLEGNIREIIGQMRLEEMVSDRQKFAELVKANADPDLAEMGLEIVSFNVQNFVDANGVIENLGVDNVVRIQKKAAISRAESEKEIAIAKSNAAKEANDAKAASLEAIAQRNAALETEQAKLKQAVDTQKAQANAAAGIESEKQRQLRDVAATDADIAKAERQAELRQREIELKEYELTAVVRKKADAERYAIEQEAAADLARRQREAEAKAYEIEQEAAAAKARAEAARYEAEQKAAGIAAVGTAEAAAIREKAEAQKLMGEASVIEMILNTLPQVVANASAPLTNVDKITMYGDGNSSKLVGDVMNATNQVLEGLASQGIDVKAMLAGALGGKLSN